MHLTNYSVNKKNTQACTPGEKWTLKMLKDHFHQHGLDYNGLSEEIEKVIITTLASGYSKLVSTARVTLGKKYCEII